MVMAFTDWNDCLDIESTNQAPDSSAKVISLDVSSHGRVLVSFEAAG